MTDQLTAAPADGSEQVAEVYDHNVITFESFYEEVDPDEIVEQARQVDRHLADLGAMHQIEKLFWDDELRERIRGRNVLEIGGGDGRNAVFMLMLGAGHVTLHEITPSTERIARECAKRLGLDDRLDVQIGNPLDVDLGGPYDAVIARLVFHHIPTDIEEEFADMLAAHTADDGWLRLIDPAVNSRRLDALRWALPAPGRPSRFSKRWDEWKANDEHPDRDNSTEHVADIFRKRFRDVRTETTAGLSRLHRWVDSERFHDPAMRALNVVDSKLPDRLQRWLAANHSITASRPIRPGR